MQFVPTMYLLIIYATNSYYNDVCTIEPSILGLDLVVTPEITDLKFGAGRRRVTLDE